MSHAITITTGDGIHYYAITTEPGECATIFEFHNCAGSANTRGIGRGFP